jgi:2,3-bisphosphoglycerate-dependent phosphoglycerate mutase
MQLYFIRHGQSANNLLWVKTGAAVGRAHDPELSELGQAQAARLGAFLSDGARLSTAPWREGWDPQNLTGFKLTHIYCSLMQRAAATGQAVARATGRPLLAWPEIHECGGLYLDGAEGEKIGQAGPGRAFFAERFPELRLPAWLGEAGWWNRPYEAETARDARAEGVLEELRRRHGGTEDRVAFISHGEFYNRFMWAALKLPAGQRTWFTLNNTAITRLDFGDEEISVTYLNRLDFMPAELVS